MEDKSLKREQARIYLKLAGRQLEMAAALLEKGFYDGSIFHSYTALESACAAGIALKGGKIPIQHRKKLIVFRELYTDLKFMKEFLEISESLFPARETSLYSDIDAGLVKDPALEFTKHDAEASLKDARHIVNKILDVLGGRLQS